MQTPTSAPAIEIPLPQTWQAKWIASRICGGRSTPAPAPYFRKDFRVETSIRSAHLHITALGLYDCSINGHEVGDHVFAPGWTDYAQRTPVQTYDVTALLQQGENAIGVVLGDGWYCGHLSWLGRQVYGDRPELLAQLEITLENGEPLILGTDLSWKTATGPLLANDILMGEAYDARLESDGWSVPGYDDRDWVPAIERGGKQIALVRSAAPPVRRTGILQPVAGAIPAAGEKRKRPLIIDLGQNFSGRVRIRVEAPAGTHLTLRYAEILQPGGDIYTENLRSALCTDYYTCRGGGLEEWEPRFTFHGFRYVEVNGLPDDARFELEGVVLHSDMPVTGSFACSHPLLNQLEHNIIWGQKSNFLEAPTDCPQRDERLGWTGDAQVFVRTAAFHMDVRGFFQKWMQDMRDAQGPEGQIPAVVPDPRPSGLPADGGPGWEDAVYIVPWTIYLCYGDLAILEENYDCMQRWMERIERSFVKDGIRCHPELKGWKGHGDWLALDGSGKTDGGTPKDLIGTAFHAHAAETMGKIARLLGREEDALKYGELQERICAAFQQRFSSPAGMLAGATQTSYVLALKFGLLSGAARAGAVRELVRDIEQRGYHLTTGFLGTPYLLDVLEENGHLDVAYQLLEQETFPGWLFPVKNGATTIWERWDGWTPEKGFQTKGMNSFNHYAYGAVGAWMVRSVAGLDLDPEEPGYRHIIFRPRPGGSITSAEARHQTPQGETSIRWELRKGELHLDLLVPEGTRATVDLATGWHISQSTLSPGRHQLHACCC